MREWMDAFMWTENKQAESENHFLFVFFKEFDNYAEWDLKDIDFVDDDSDILHGELDVSLFGQYFSSTTSW